MFLKNIFSLKVTVFNTGKSCSHPFSRVLYFFISRKMLQPSIPWILNLFQKSTCNRSLCIYYVFDKYFYFRCTIISEDCLQPNILSVTIIISEGSTYSDLVFFRMLCFFEISSYSHVFMERHRIKSPHYLKPSTLWKNPLFHYKIAVAAKHFFKFTVFFTRAVEGRYHSFQLSYQL